MLEVYTTKEAIQNSVNTGCLVYGTNFSETTPNEKDLKHNKEAYKTEPDNLGNVEALVRGRLRQATNLRPVDTTPILTDFWDMTQSEVDGKWFFKFDFNDPFADGGDITFIICSVVDNKLKFEYARNEYTILYLKDDTCEGTLEEINVVLNTLFGFYIETSKTCT